MSPWERIHFYLLSSFSAAYTHPRLKRTAGDLSRRKCALLSGSPGSFCCLNFHVSNFKGQSKSRSFGVWRGLMLVIRHRLSHQQGWTPMSEAKGLMPTTKGLSHTFSVGCDFWPRALIISHNTFPYVLHVSWWISHVWCWEKKKSANVGYKTTGNNTNDMRVHILWWVYDDKLVWKIIISTLISWVLSSELA